MNLKFKAGLLFILSFSMSIFGISFLFYYFNLWIYFLTNISTILGSILILITGTLISIIISRKYYKNKLRKLKLDDSEFNKLIKPLIGNKVEISIDELYKLFGLEKNFESDIEYRKLLNKKIFSWISKYNFLIREDKILLDPNSITPIIDELDKLHYKWKIKDKSKKI